MITIGKVNIIKMYSGVEKERTQYPIEYISTECNIVFKGNLRGILANCLYRQRNVQQYISSEEMEKFGLHYIKDKNLEVSTKETKDKRVRMSLISYAVLREKERGNKMLREWDYEKNTEDIKRIAYKSTKIIHWISEVNKKEFSSSLKNRVDSGSDCNSNRVYYVTSQEEEMIKEMIKIMLEKGKLKAEEQAEIKNGDRRKVDILINDNIIVEIDGDFHSKEEDDRKDLEAKKSGYKTIRIIIIDFLNHGLDINYIEYWNSDSMPYNEETDTERIILNYDKYKNVLEMFNQASKRLEGILERYLNKDIELGKATYGLIEEAKNARLFNGKKVVYESCA